jgi:hypothetical protein
MHNPHNLNRFQRIPSISYTAEKKNHEITINKFEKVNLPEWPLHMKSVKGIQTMV